MPTPPEGLGLAPADHHRVGQIHGSPAAHERTPPKLIARSNDRAAPLLGPSAVRPNKQRSGRTGVALCDGSDLASKDPLSDGLTEPFADLSADHPAYQVVDHTLRLPAGRSFGPAP